MKDELEKSSRKLGGIFCWNIPSYLGLESKQQRNFIFAMEKKMVLGKGSFFNWLNRGFPVKIPFEAQELWQAVENTYNEFLLNVEITSEQRNRMAECWSERSEFLRQCIDTLFASMVCKDFFKEYFQEFLDKQGKSIKTCPPWFVYKLNANFDGYRSITDNDLLFVLKLLTEGKRESVIAEVAAEEMKPSAEIIQGLLDEHSSGKEWWEIRNNSYTNSLKNNKNSSDLSWDKFLDKLKKLPFEEYQRFIYFLMLIWPDNIGVSPFETEEIDLLLIFKYCLTTEAQERILKNKV